MPASSAGAVRAVSFCAPAWFASIACVRAMSASCLSSNTKFSRGYVAFAISRRLSPPKNSAGIGIGADPYSPLLIFACVSGGITSALNTRIGMLLSRIRICCSRNLLSSFTCGRRRSILPR